MIACIVSGFGCFIAGWLMGWRSTRYYRVGVADGAAIAHAVAGNEWMRVFALRRAAEVRRKEGVSLDLPTEGEP